MLILGMDLNADKRSAFECPAGYNELSYLEKLSMDGAIKRWGSIDDCLRKRIEKELAVIHEHNWETYFLVLWDCIRYARSLGIYVAPGRGALPSSVVAYCLGVTGVDPIKYVLLFERYLSARDGYWIDIELSRQYEVFEYAITKYGEAIPELIIEVSHDEACLGDVQEVEIIGRTLEQINKRTGEKINIYEIEYNDLSVFESIESGHGDDFSFALNVDGEEYWHNIKPRSMEDLIAGIGLSPEFEEIWSRKAIYELYITGKKARDNGVIEHNPFKKFLQGTYGQLIYHEQIMQVFEELGGFSPNQANEARRALCGRRLSKIKQYKDMFIRGCVAYGLSKEDGETIYDEMEDNAIYTLNKSHFAAIAMLLYQVVWLKYYYPTDYENAIASINI